MRRESIPTVDTVRRPAYRDDMKHLASFRLAALAALGSAALLTTTSTNLFAQAQGGGGISAPGSGKAQGGGSMELKDQGEAQGGGGMELKEGGEAKGGGGMELKEGGEAQGGGDLSYESAAATLTNVTGGLGAAEDKKAGLGGGLDSIEGDGGGGAVEDEGYTLWIIVAIVLVLAILALTLYNKKFKSGGTMNTTPPNSQSGFTLVELLVVISIIALLAGLATPALQNARREGFKVADVNNLKQIGTSIKLFSNDYDGMFPIKWESGKDVSAMKTADASNANDAFRALFGTSTLKDERIFFTQGTSIFRKPDNDIGKAPDYSKALEKKENSYAYFAGHSEGSESTDPLAWNPTSGGLQPDGEKGWKASGALQQIHAGKGVNVFRVDGSVSWVPKLADNTIPVGGSESSTKLDIKALAPDI